MRGGFFGSSVALVRLRIRQRRYEGAIHGLGNGVGLLLRAPSLPWMKVIEWCADRRRVGLNIVCKNVAEGDDFTKSDPRQGGEWGAHDR